MLRRSVGLVMGLSVAIAIGCGAKDDGEGDLGFYGFGGGVGASAGAGGFGATAGTSGVGATGGTSGIGASGGIGGTAGTGATGGVGGSDSGLEICTNSIDDDGDGLVDCADADCGAYQCVPTAPAGWQGPIALFTGTTNEICSGDFPVTMMSGMKDFVIPPVTCAGCGCAPPLGTVCPLATLRFSPQAACSPLGGTFTIPANVCQPFILTTSNAESVLWETAPAAGGACAPVKNGSNQIPAFSWKDKALACAPLDVGGGCGSEVCAPVPEAPFGAELCIHKLGDNACPAGFPQKITYFTGAQDTRTCTDCLCGAPTGGTCSGTVVLGTNASCSVDVVTIPQVNTCGPLPEDPTPPPPPYMESRSARFDAGIAFGGSCGSTGGTPSGTVTGVSPITFCCP
jgi:hypothetical protein